MNRKSFKKVQKASQEATRLAVKKLLKNGLKLGGFTTWVLMIFWDLGWAIFIKPFLNKQNAKRIGRKYKEGRLKLMDGVKKADNFKSIVEAHKASYGIRKK